eukprot:TRINITY_DN38778_c0_g2_i1.p1 TRINITY_DN38778_c0_g2~~TRINITY_DN38778_c0_g2_i1.p1  ORF type:complete len:231 (-),score=38.51 TRINITY_DN38778_c0_g2_i1:426-1118(-)
MLAASDHPECTPESVAAGDLLRPVDECDCDAVPGDTELVDLKDRFLFWLKGCQTFLTQLVVDDDSACPYADAGHIVFLRMQFDLLRLNTSHTDHVCHYVDQRLASEMLKSSVTLDVMFSSLPDAHALNLLGRILHEAVDSATASDVDSAVLVDAEHGFDTPKPHGVALSQLDSRFGLDFVVAHGPISCDSRGYNVATPSSPAMAFAQFLEVHPAVCKSIFEKSATSTDVM